jgi:hypothetical protein
MSFRISASLFGVALALTVTTASAAEDENSANNMLPGCWTLLNLRSPADRAPTSQEDAIRAAWCAGVVDGISFMGLSVSPSSDPMVHYGYCINVPDEATLVQKVRVVVAYIEARPARMHEDFRYLALIALRTAWPCK